MRAKGRRGISPLIGSIMVVAFTVGAAAIIASFATTFTQERTEDVSGQGEQIIDCSEVVVDINSVFDDGDSISVVASLSAPKSVTNATFTVVTNGSGGPTYTDYIASQWDAGETRDFSVTTDASGPEEVMEELTLLPQNCPGAGARRSYSHETVTVSGQTASTVTESLQVGDVHVKPRVDLSSIDSVSANDSIGTFTGSRSLAVNFTANNQPASPSSAVLRLTGN